MTSQFLDDRGQQALTKPSSDADVTGTSPPFVANDDIEQGITFDWNAPDRDFRPKPLSGFTVILDGSPSVLPADLGAIIPSFLDGEDSGGTWGVALFDFVSAASATPLGWNGRQDNGTPLDPEPSLDTIETQLYFEDQFDPASLDHYAYVGRWTDGAGVRWHLYTTKPGVGINWDTGEIDSESADTGDFSFHALTM